MGGEEMVDVEKSGRGVGVRGNGVKGGGEGCGKDYGEMDGMGDGEKSVKGVEGCGMDGEGNGSGGMESFETGGGVSSVARRKVFLPSVEVVYRSLLATVFPSCRGDVVKQHYKMPARYNHYPQSLLMKFCSGFYLHFVILQTAHVRLISVVRFIHLNHLRSALKTYVHNHLILKYSVKKAPIKSSTLRKRSYMTPAGFWSFWTPPLVSIHQHWEPCRRQHYPP